MSIPSGIKHDNYEILNLIGYGLAKFESGLIAELGFKTKTVWFNDLIERGVAKTVGTLKNRQDLFNPLVRGTKVGWWQNGDRYIHRKILLDSLFGDLNAAGYAALIEHYLRTHFPVSGEAPKAIAPLLTSKFRSLQETGNEAEVYFMNRYDTIPQFKGGKLDDARLFGDGYDFQLTLPESFLLIEVKGVRGNSGGLRLTENEFLKAEEFTGTYCLAVVSRLEATPRITLVFDPTISLPLVKKSTVIEQVYYSSPSRKW